MAHAQPLMPTEQTYRNLYGLSVITYVGDISTIADATAIVTGEDKKFENESFITKALLKLSPLEFAEKRLELKRRGLKSWMVRTSKLLPPSPFKYVFHALMKKEHKKWVEKMKGMYKKVLKKAEKYEVESLVLPLLGSGRASSKVSIEDAVQAVVESIAIFKNKRLKKIFLVTLDKGIAEKMAVQCMYSFRPKIKRRRTFNTRHRRSNETQPVNPEQAMASQHGQVQPLSRRSNTFPRMSKKNHSDDEEGGFVDKTSVKPRTRVNDDTFYPERKRSYTDRHSEDQIIMYGGYTDKADQHSRANSNDKSQHRDQQKGCHGYGNGPTQAHSYGGYTDKADQHGRDNSNYDKSQHRDHQKGCHGYGNGPTQAHSQVKSSNLTVEAAVIESSQSGALDTGGSASKRIVGRRNQHQKDINVSAGVDNSKDKVVVKDEKFQTHSQVGYADFKVETAIIESPPQSDMLDTGGSARKRIMGRKNQHQKDVDASAGFGNLKDNVDVKDKKLHTFPKRNETVVTMQKSGQTYSRTIESGHVKQPKDGHQVKKDEPVNMLDLSVSRNCPICISPITDPKWLDKCGHVFCRDCIDDSFKHFKPVCPSCNMVYGVLTGNQPDGTMDVGFSGDHLPGYEGHGTITITYYFPSGIQEEGHPNPGHQYKGTTRRAYLPDCSQGREILKLLKTAFDRKLTFTIGRSTTTGQENVVTWNDIHHKTNMDGGPTRFGYPDPGYLARVKDELASKGVTQEEKKQETTF